MRNALVWSKVPDSTESEYTADGSNGRRYFVRRSVAARAWMLDWSDRDPRAISTVGYERLKAAQAGADRMEAISPKEV